MAAVLLFANNASTTLAGPLSTTSTTCNVAAGTGVEFPQPGGNQLFKLTFIDAATKTLTEIVHVTGVSGDAFTILRAQEGTTALNWNAGDIAANLITAGTFGAFAQTAALPASTVSGTDTGAGGANAVVVSATTPSISTPVVGQTFEITKSNTTNTGPVTLQVVSSAAASVVYNDGTALAAGAWPAGATGLFVYTGGVYQVLTLGSSPAFGQPAQPPRLLSFVVDATTTANQYVGTGYPTTLTQYTRGLQIETIPALGNTGAATINVDGLGAVQILRNDGSALQAYDIPAKTLIVFVYSTTFNAFLIDGFAPSQVVRQLPQGANTILYVRTDGNDANNGSANNPGAAFLTIAAAIKYGLSAFSLAGGALTIQLGIPGTYAPPGYVPPLLGTLNIYGSAANQANYVISGPGPAAGAGNAGLFFFQGGYANLIGVTVVNTAARNNSLIAQDSFVNVGNISWQTTTTNNNSFLTVSYGGSVVDTGGCIYEGSMGYLASAVSGYVTFAGSSTVANNPSFGVTAFASDNGIITLNPGVTLSGAATGQRYVASFNGIITVYGAGAQAFPGNAPGATSNNGFYG